MAKKKFKPKATRKVTPMTRRAPAAVSAHSDEDNEVLPEHADDNEDTETAEVAPQTPAEPAKPVDKEKVNSLFDSAFEQEREIVRQLENVTKARAKLTAIVVELQEAVNGKSGPFLVNGDRVQIRVRRNKANEVVRGFLFTEKAQELEMFETTTRRMSEAAE